MKTLKKIVFTGLLALIACAGVAQAQELYKDEKAPCPAARPARKRLFTNWER